ncbi:MAG: hypothetical protein GY913_17970 [Proteobacteria bacterium]|nr:hypothetical protein [Pseudomonadota bacterium]MCP4918795.1 hypothetical protein [Pseudomonadota bacterium]
MLSVLLSLVLACGPDEPILPGVVVAEEGTTASESVTYTKSEGVFVDVGYLAGRNFEEMRGEVSQQLGDIQEVNDLGARDGTEYVLETGRVKVKDDVIYLIHVDLDRPMRQSSAMSTLGLPSEIDAPYMLTTEIRLRWHAGFDRIRMGRATRDDDLVIWVEALKFDPRDR